MAIALNETDIKRIAGLPQVREAACSAEKLTALWPLDSALQMDNDAKYTEDLQVRFTLAFARVLTGLDVGRRGIRVRGRRCHSGKTSGDRRCAACLRRGIRDHGELRT